MTQELPKLVYCIPQRPLNLWFACLNEIFTFEKIFTAHKYAFRPYIYETYVLTRCSTHLYFHFQIAVMNRLRDRFSYARAHLVNAQSPRANAHRARKVMKYVGSKIAQRFCARALRERSHLRGWGHNFRQSWWWWDHHHHPHHLDGGGGFTSILSPPPA